MRGSKIPKQNDGNKNFVDNCQNLPGAMSWEMRGSKDPNKNDEKYECNDFDENCKKSLSTMRRRMIGCKFYSKNDNNNDFD